MNRKLTRDERVVRTTALTFVAFAIAAFTLNACDREPRSISDYLGVPDDGISSVEITTRDGWGGSR